jgi:hypothetical protein
MGILKEGRAVDDPESYGLVGLECCLRKVFTPLLDGRLHEWAASVNFIPDSQNGFQIFEKFALLLGINELAPRRSGQRF